jgi:ribosomal subunit interface protein
MQQPLQITFRGVERSDSIEGLIREKAAHLERFYPNLTSCRVVVDAPHQRQHHGRLYSVRLDIRVPNAEVVVNKGDAREHEHEDVYVAIRDAFSAAVRQLEDYARHQRGEVKRHSRPAPDKLSKLSA